jgi:ribosomal protein S12 methylthiotransferase accessory factor
MEIKVNFLDKLRLEAKFDDFTVIADQPIRYKGDGSAPGPFDYFLASSALCAAYFVKLYCDTRNIPTENIRLSQNNIVDPENRYQQIFKIQVELPAGYLRQGPPGHPALDRPLHRQESGAGRARVRDRRSREPGCRCAGPADPAARRRRAAPISRARICRWSRPSPICRACWRPGHQDRNRFVAQYRAECVVAAYPRCALADVFHQRQGRDQGKRAGLGPGRVHRAPEQQPFLCRRYWGEDIANAPFVHYPDERWFKPGKDDALPAGILDEYCLDIYDPDGELRGSHLIDTNSGNVERGIVSLPYVRQSDGETVYFPSNLIENLYASNGMSAGNTLAEAQVQCLSEIFERAVKREILEGELALPDVPQEVLAKYPGILAGIQGLEEQGFPVLVKDASLGGPIR